jgi:hypothetical protein
MTHYVIEVVDRQVPALTGTAGCAYTSPPQSLEDALRLVRMLLCLPRAPVGERWRHPIAGGQRTVTLRRIS